MGKEKVYLSGVLIREHTFDDGGSILKVAIKIEEFIPLLSQQKVKNGWVNLELGKRREPSKKGLTHYLRVDDYEKENTQSSPRSEEHSGTTFYDQATEDKDDDLPF